MVSVAHSVALCFPVFGVVPRENRAIPPAKGPVAPAFSALEVGVALQVASWKESRYRGVSQLHCRLSRCSGALRQPQARGLSAGCVEITETKDMAKPLESGVRTTGSPNNGFRSTRFPMT